jgi:hypothetical protein
MMEATAEQRTAVARDDCRVHGHELEMMLVLRSMAPQSIVCRRCGSSWRVHPDDVNENWGTGAHRAEG